MKAQPFWNIGEPARHTPIGGFNLLPYRRREASHARRRMLVECLFAVLAGCAAVGVRAGWEAIERGRLATQRETLEATLAGFAAPLAEHRRLEGMRTEARTHAMMAQKLSGPRTRLVDLFYALSREPYPGIVLHGLKQSHGDVTLLAGAKDSAASTAWLTRLSGVPGVRAVDVVDVQHVSVSPGKHASGARNVIELAARLHWEGANATSAGDMRRAENKWSTR